MVLILFKNNLTFSVDVSASLPSSGLNFYFHLNKANFRIQSDNFLFDDVSVRKTFFKSDFLHTDGLLEIERVINPVFGTY